MTAMKTTIKYFCMAALLVAVATIAGCTKEENNGDGQTLTTSVSLPDNDAKALDEHGVKTFAVGDQIKMTYTINEREKNIDSRPLTARDISANGKVANFSFIIPSGVTVPRNGNVRFQYPANFRTPITQGQDGTLATLASYYDLAICVTRFSSRSELPANIQLHHSDSDRFNLRIQSYLRGNTYEQRLFHPKHYLHRHRQQQRHLHEDRHQQETPAWTPLSRGGRDDGADVYLHHTKLHLSQPHLQ